MKLVLIFVLILIFAVIALLFFTPEQEVVRKTISLAVPQDEVWEKMVNIKEQIVWRSDLKDVQLVEGSSSNPLRWNEILSDGSDISFQTVSIDPLKKFEIAFQNKFMQGTWEGVLHQASIGNTSLEIIEKVKIHNPIFRTIYHFSDGLEKFAEHWSTQFAASFGGKK